MKKRQRLTMDDFITGLFSALSQEGVRTLSLGVNRIDSILGTLFPEIRKEVENRGLKVAFRIRPHPIHGDSMTLREAILSALQRGIVTIDAPSSPPIMRIHIDPESAHFFFEFLPGSPDMYQGFAKQFMELYNPS